MTKKPVKNQEDLNKLEETGVPFDPKEAAKKISNEELFARLDEYAESRKLEEEDKRQTVPLCLSQKELEELKTKVKKSQEEWAHFFKTGEAGEEIKFYIELSKKAAKEKMKK